jgi:hypothetical protein
MLRFIYNQRGTQLRVHEDFITFTGVLRGMTLTAVEWELSVISGSVSMVCDTEFSGPDTLLHYRVDHSTECYFKLIRKDRKEAILVKAYTSNTGRPWTKVHEVAPCKPQRS